MNVFEIRKACQCSSKRGQPSRWFRTIFIYWMLGIFLAQIGMGLANSSLLPETGLIDAVIQSPVTADHLKPPECNGINLSQIVNAGGVFNGTPENDLILGSIGIDIVDGLGGNDCILGGDQADQLFGGSPGGPENVRDKFNTISYSNNDGTQNWASDWLEIGESDGPVYGDVNVEVSQGRGRFTLPVNQDTYIEQRNPNNNFGTNNELKVKAQADDYKRSLYRFNLSQIPTGANVLSATVYFFVTGNNNNPVNVHRVTDSWGESTATWNNANGIFDSVPAASFTPAINNQYVSANITALVQQWVNNTVPNHGLMLIGTVNNETKYASRENTPDRHPYLSIRLATGGIAQALRIQNAVKGAYRSVDLCNAISATLQFEYLRQDLDDANDTVTIEISSDGGFSWTPLGSIAGPLNDTQMQFLSFDITAYLSCSTAIRFLSSALMGPDDKVYIDNVQITYMDIPSTGGNDVLLGGPGDDYLDGGGGVDSCYGGSGVNTFVNCENIIDP